MNAKLSLNLAVAVLVYVPNFIVSAATASNPYETIVLRNPFGLRAPAVAPASLPENYAQVPLPEIRITGITTLLGAPKATFEYEDKLAKRIEFPPLLGEGETYKLLSVVAIDADNNRVRIRNGENEATLDFTTHGVKPSRAAPAISPAASPLQTTPPPMSGRVIVAGPLPAMTLPASIVSELRERAKAAQSGSAEQPHLPFPPGFGNGPTRSPSLNGR